MKIRKELAHEFYQNLGKLFYAIAVIDNNVRDEELDKLKGIIREEWLTTDLITDSLKINIEDSIINTFKWLHSDNEYNAKACFNSFLTFKKKHESLFTDDINRLILKTARVVAYSFSQVNKSELILLAKLGLELNK
jgi:hypothetical protein